MVVCSLTSIPPLHRRACLGAGSAPRSVVRQMPTRMHLRGVEVGVSVLGWDLRLLSSLLRITPLRKTNLSHQLFLGFCFSS